MAVAQIQTLILSQRIKYVCFLVSCCVMMNQFHLMSFILIIDSLRPKKVKTEMLIHPFLIQTRSKAQNYRYV